MIMFGIGSIGPAISTGVSVVVLGRVIVGIGAAGSLSGIRLYLSSFSSAKPPYSAISMLLVYSVARFFGPL
jgi:hypothetical protein